MVRFSWGKKLLNIKCVFWFSLEFLSETFLILKRNERDTIKMYIGLLVYFLLGISPASNCSWPTTIWRRGNTQKKIYNIQITAKVWNQESYWCWVTSSKLRTVCPPALRLALSHGSNSIGFLKYLISYSLGRTRSSYQIELLMTEAVSALESWRISSIRQTVNVIFLQLLQASLNGATKWSQIENSFILCFVFMYW